MRLAAGSTVIVAITPAFATGLAPWTAVVIVMELMRGRWAARRRRRAVALGRAGVVALGPEWQPAVQLLQDAFEDVLRHPLDDGVDDALLVISAFIAVTRPGSAFVAISATRFARSGLVLATLRAVTRMTAGRLGAAALIPLGSVSLGAPGRAAKPLLQRFQPS
jgi:hypothetical protein